MRFRFLILGVLLVPGIIDLAVPITTREASADVTALVPAYFYPAGPDLGYWDKLDASAQQIPLTAIMNQDNGVVTSLNSDYPTATDKLVANGGRVIGYLNTDRGAFNVDDLKTYIDNYASFYKVSGFFLDVMSFQEVDLPKYQELYDYIHTKHPGFNVIGNPGVAFDYLHPSFSLSNYLDDNGKKAADSLVVFEGPYHADGTFDASFDRFPNQFPYTQYDLSWMSASSNSQLGNIVSATDQSLLSQALSMAVNPATNNAGYVYITDNVNNPYDRLPSYWDQEVALIKGLNAVPEPSTLVVAVTCGMFGLAALTLKRRPSAEPH